MIIEDRFDMCTILAQHDTRTVEVNLTNDDASVDLNKINKGYNCILYGYKILNNQNLRSIVSSLKTKGVNIDLYISQEEIKDNQELLKNLVGDFLIDTISVYLRDSHEKEDFKFIDLLADRAVINVIADTLTKHDLIALTGRNVRFFCATESHKLDVEPKEREKHISWLKKHLPVLKNMCKTIEFDKTCTFQDF